MKQLNTYKKLSIINLYRLRGYKYKINFNYKPAYFARVREDI
ncbi:MAG: hypothetical protein ACOCP8_07825 [archaeon]